MKNHTEVPKAIKDAQELGWHLYTYQVAGVAREIKHYLLFEKEASEAEVAKPA